MHTFLTKFIIFTAVVSCAGASPRYDQITWLCTHNAMNSADAGWKAPNQTHTITAQLNNGVRALMLDIHRQDSGLVLRHGPPIARMLGYQPLPKALEEIRAFMQKDQKAIVTLILESYAPAKEVAQAITDAKLGSLCHTQNPGKPWPTLASMRSSGKRLVILSDRVEKGTSAPGWYMHVWQHCWETDWVAKNKDHLLQAKPRRGKQSNQLFILNHFITRTLPSKELSKAANTNPFLINRINKVRKDFGKKPNFLVLDFYELGDAQKTIQTLNNPTPEE